MSASLAEPLRLVQYEPRKTCALRGHDVAACKARWHTVVRLHDHETNIGDFDVIACDECHLGFTEPVPTEETVAGLYEGRTTTDYEHAKDSVVDRLKDRLSERQLKKLARGLRVERFLDYSTGNGRFALSASRAFPNAKIDAVDFEPTPPRLLVNTPPRIRYFQHDAFDAEDVEYDLIVLRHVLEHTHHPVDLITKLGRRLSPRGVLYIEVPNLDSGCAKVFGKNWKGYYVPRHLLHFTEASLAEVVERAGLKAEIGRNEMPLMGNTVAILTGADMGNVLVQLLGVALHPAQLAIEKAHDSATCIHAKCRRPA